MLTAQAPTSGILYIIKHGLSRCVLCKIISSFVFSIRSGILDSRRMLDMGMKIGLGTGEYIVHTITKIEPSLY